MSGPRRTAAHLCEEFPGAALSPEQVAFGRAMERYKRENGRPHPTWAEVLAVAHSLGYREVAGQRPRTGVRASPGARGRRGSRRRPDDEPPPG